MFPKKSLEFYDDWVFPWTVYEIALWIVSFIFLIYYVSILYHLDKDMSKLKVEATTCHYTYFLKGPEQCFGNNLFLWTLECSTGLS